MSVLSPEWTAKVADWRRSGLSIAAWCREHNEGYHRFIYWRKRLQVPGRTESGSFVESSLAASPISFECNGVLVHVASGFDVRLLEDILSLLKRG
jgi:hypothetical protein